jgi:hypothetical protein
MLLASQAVTCQTKLYRFSQQAFQDFESLHDRIASLCELDGDAEACCYDNDCCVNGCCEELLTFSDFKVIRKELSEVEQLLLTELPLPLKEYDLECLRRSVEDQEQYISLEYAAECDEEILTLGMVYLPEDLMKLVLQYLINY